MLLRNEAKRQFCLYDVLQNVMLPLFLHPHVGREVLLRKIFVEYVVELSSAITAEFGEVVQVACFRTVILHQCAERYVLPEKVVEQLYLHVHRVVEAKYPEQRFNH